MARSAVDDRICSAALGLLRSRGPAAVSIESVASASGIAKTTIYRRYENSEALLTGAIMSATTAVEIPDGLAAQDALRWVLRHARDTSSTLSVAAPWPPSWSTRTQASRRSCSA